MKLCSSFRCVYLWGTHIIKSSTHRSFCCGRSKSALVVINDGAEELETVSVVDVLRRGDVDVSIASLLGCQPIKCFSNTQLCPDIPLACVVDIYDAIVLPGGSAGAKGLANSKELGLLLREQEEENRIIGAICGAPTILKAHRIGYGKYITSHPNVELWLRDTYRHLGYYPVVKDRNLISSRGPGTALLFALTLLEELCGKAKARKVADAMLYEYNCM